MIINIHRLFQALKKYEILKRTKLQKTLVGSFEQELPQVPLIFLAAIPLYWQ